MTPSTWTWTRRNKGSTGEAGLQGLLHPVLARGNHGEGGSGKAAFAACNSLIHKPKVTQVKQYLVAKMIAGVKSRPAELIPLPGLYTLVAAQDFVMKALAAEPESNYLIQEVGAA